MRLGIDLDGVVADFNAGWIRKYNRDFGAAIPLDVIQVWDGLHELTHFPDMQGFWRWARGKGDGSLFRHLETYDEAIPTLNDLVEDGHQVVILTQKPDWAVHDTIAWIADHRIPTREIHVLSDKWRVACDVYLDDAPAQIEAIHRARPEAVVCRFVRPWNEAHPGVRDVADWRDFATLVRSAVAGTRSRVG